MRTLASILVCAGCFTTPPAPDFGDAAGTNDGKPACLDSGDVMGVAITAAVDGAGDTLFRASTRGLVASIHRFAPGAAFDAQCPSDSLVLDQNDLDPALGSIDVEAMTFANYQGRPTLFVYASRGGGHTGATLFEVDASSGGLAIVPGHFTRGSAPGEFNVSGASTRPAFVAYNDTSNTIWFGGGKVVQVVPTVPAIPTDGVVAPALFSPARPEGWFAAAPFPISGGRSFILVGARASYQASFSQMVVTDDIGPRTGACDNSNLDLCVRRIVHEGPPPKIVTSIDISGALEFVDVNPASRFHHTITTMVNEPIVDFVAGDFIGGGSPDVVVLLAGQGAPSTYVLAIAPAALQPAAPETFTLEQRTALGTDAATQIVAGRFAGAASSTRFLVLGPSASSTKCYRLDGVVFVGC
jgi:hypothetical protein